MNNEPEFPADPANLLPFVREFRPSGPNAEQLPRRRYNWHAEEAPVDNELKKRCYNRRIKSLKKIDMENVKDIAFNDDGSLTITLKDGSAPTNYVPASAAPAAPTQTVALASGETLLVTAA
jgi:hypothetical protein